MTRVDDIQARQATSQNETPWEKEDDVECVVCPDCAFTFDAFHSDADERYSCPACYESAARDDVGWLLNRVTRLETAIRHVVNDSPGTPESVKGYLRAALDTEQT